MAHNTKIPYVTRALPIVTGCEHVGDGCLNCWAEGLCATRLKHLSQYAGLTNEDGKWTGEVRFHDDLLRLLYRWRKPQLVFVSTMGDLFHRNVDAQEIVRAFETMRSTPRHTYLVFTKRPHRALAYLYNSTEQAIEPIDNVVIIASAHDQETTDRTCKNLAALAGCGWRVGLSLEPLLGPVDLKPLIDTPESWCEWITIGCESGPKRRPCDTRWIHRVAADCDRDRIRCWVKQTQIGPAKPGKVPRVSHDRAEWPHWLCFQEPVRGWAYRDGKLVPEK